MFPPRCRQNCGCEGFQTQACTGEFLSPCADKERPNCLATSYNQCMHTSPSIEHCLTPIRSDPRLSDFLCNTVAVRIQVHISRDADCLPRIQVVWRRGNTNVDDAASIPRKTGLRTRRNCGFSRQLALHSSTSRGPTFDVQATCEPSDLATRVLVKLQ